MKISVLLVASTRLSAVVKLSPVTSVSCSQTSLIYSGSAFRPVPTAVAPMFMVCSSSQLRRMQLLRLRMEEAKALNSRPKVIGTASCRCVRPIFSTSLNSSPFLSKESARFSKAIISCSARIRAQTRMDVGITSLVDCDILAWLLGLI